MSYDVQLIDSQTGKVIMEGSTLNVKGIELRTIVRNIKPHLHLCKNGHNIGHPKFEIN